MNGADLFAGCLKAQGVEWISTLCGHGLNQLYAACLRQGIRLVDVRNEQSAAYMAECWGRLSRRVGVCAASSGVAHANALSGLVNAYFDGAPVLLVSGAGPLATAGMGHFQDLDQVALAAPVCKYARVVERAERIPEYVHEAFVAALAGRPGPVHLSLPMDVQEAPVESPAPPQSSGARVRTRPEPGAVERAADLLAECQKPLLVAGSGAYYARAEKALADLAAAFAIPVVVPIWDRGAVPGPMEEFMGVVGAASGGPDLLAAADLLILLGAEPDYRVGYLQSPPLRPGVRVARVDADPRRLGKRRAGELEVLADPGLFLEELQEVLAVRQADGFEAWLQEARERRDAFGARVVARGRQTAKEAKGSLHALDIVEALDEVLDPEAVLVVDGGNIGQWAHQRLARRRYPGHWLTCGASGVVGYGIAGAMAARLLYPNRQVVLLSGDGSATFTLAELECAMRQDLPFLMVVADDESWGITETGHRKRFGRAMSSHLGPVEFSEVARALGALGARVGERDELVAVLRRGLNESGPALVHVPICGGMPEVD